MKKIGYKYKIEKVLLETNWNICIIDSNDECWDDEHWIIDCKFDSKISFYLCFIIDPMFKFDKQNRPDIREVKASLMFPKYWNDNESKLTSINMRKDMFNRKHKDFIQDLEELKKYCQKCICVNAPIRSHSAYTSRTLYGIKMNRELIRYWITLNQQERPIGFGLGIGITAYSEEDMLSILRDRIEQEIKIEKVQIIRSLDELEQNHVLPNMEEFVFRGMWYPKGFK